MKKYDPLWHLINSLLAQLKSFNIRKRVDDYYLYVFDNPAPGECVSETMDKLQRLLDEAEAPK